MASGDIVILFCAIDAQAAAFDPADLPSSFTELIETDITADGHTAWVGWKRLTGADSGSYTFGDVGATADWVCQAFAFSGRHATNPPVASTVNVQNTPQSSPVTVSANGVTAVDGDDLWWGSAPDVTSSGAGNGHTAPTGYTEAEDSENAWANLSGAYKENVSAGATGTVSGTFALSQDSAGWAAFLIRIPLADAGPPGGYYLNENGTDRFLLEDSSGLLIMEETTGGTTFNITPSGSITPSGALIKQANKSLAGAITPSGALVKLVSKLLSGAITPSGALTTLRVILRTFSGAITPSGALVKQVNKALSSAITPAGALIKQVNKALSGAITPSGALALIKVLLRTFSGSITPTGALSKQASKSLAGAIAPAGALAKSIAKKVVGAITPTGSLATLRVLLRTFTGAITPTGTLKRSTSKTLTGSITPSGALAKSISKLFSGILTLAGSLFNFVAGQPLSNVIVTLSEKVVTPVSVSETEIIKVTLSESTITSAETSDELGG